MQTLSLPLLTVRCKVPIYPTKIQSEHINKTLGCCRKIWNLCVGHIQEQYNAKQKDPSLPYSDTSETGLSKLVQQFRLEYPYLNEVSQQSLYQTIRTLSETFRNTFRNIKKGKRAGWPQFKKRNNYASYNIVGIGQDFYIEGKYLKLPRIKSKIRCHKMVLDLPDTVSSVRIIRDATGKYYASFVYKRYPTITNGSELIGIDLGIKSLAVLSTGEEITNPRVLKVYAAKLKRAQQRLSRRVKGSKNRDKARVAVARIHERISNIRHDYLHQTSRSIVNRARVIAMETLNISGMAKNSHLSKAVSDAGLSTLKQMILYKAKSSQHVRVVLLDPWTPSTSLCSYCGKRPSTKLTLSVRHWTCEHCGTDHDRDHNAALNILYQGLITLKRYPEQDIPGSMTLANAWIPGYEDVYLKELNDSLPYGIREIKPEECSGLTRRTRNLQRKSVVSVRTTDQQTS